jgi:hypothetical protein
MKKNCETEIVSRFGLSKTAKEVYDELRALFEGKTVTDLGIIPARVIRLSFDDRNLTIEQHISDFEKKWNFMRSTLSSGTFPDKNQKFGGYLKGISECDDAKAEFVLLTLPQFYNNLVENIRAKGGYGYRDVVRSLLLYIPVRQRNRKRRDTPGDSPENPVVLATHQKSADKKGNDKTCRYCKEVRG